MEVCEIGQKVDNVTCDWPALKQKIPIFHSRTKHIDILHHFIRYHIEKGLVKLQYVQSSDNKADIMTKPFPGPKFQNIFHSLLHDFQK